ncbi:hypothetical protein Tco_0332391, partial [Tanacetum coccineum]
MDGEVWDEEDRVVVFAYEVPIKTLVIDGNCRVEDRHAEASSKTKNSKKVFMLCPQRDALVCGSGSKQTYRVITVRDPSGDELELSPGGSCTK